MCVQGSWKAAAKLLAIGALTLLIAPTAPAQSPSFSTLTPESGVLGGSFVILLPVANSGTGTAGAVTVASASFGSAALTGPTLPLPLGALAKGGMNQLVLHFDSSHLILGGKYLLTVRGSYQFGGATLGFAVNRFLSVTLPSSSVQIDLQRWVAFDAIRAELASLPHIDQIADGQAILSFVQSRPEFVASGIYPDSSSVWARFADGFPLIVGNDFYPISDSSTASASVNTTPQQVRAPNVTAPQGTEEPNLSPVSRNSKRTKSIAAPMSAFGVQPTELPTSSSARLLNTLDQYGDPNLIPNLFSWLFAQNYTPDILADESVEGLKTVGGDGILFFRTHGGFAVDANGASVYGLWTSTAANFMNFADYFASGDLEPTDSPLVWFEGLKAPGISELHYAITAKFIEKYWSAFSQNSLVYVDACDSDVDPNFKQAIFDEDASVYAGWPTSTGDPFAAGTARLVFDRLLGANQFCPETNPSSVTPCTLSSASPPIFPQRPFDYTAVSGTEFSWHGLGLVANPLSPHYGTVLNFTPNPNPEVTPGSSFGLLAPSIADMAVDDVLSPPQLFLVGSFGSDQGTVTVGGENLANLGWTSGLIQADLLPDLTGDVVVTVRGHKSNVARLTSWEGDFTAKTIGIGSLKQNLGLHLAFREDIRQFRPVIHEPPIEPRFLSAIYAISPGSSATFNCSGTGATSFSNGSDTYTWTGSANLVPLNQTTGSLPATFIMIGAFINSHTQMNITALGINSNFPFVPCTQNDHVVVFRPPSEFDMTAQFPICFSPPVFILHLDEGATIQADTLPLPPNSCSWPTNFSQGTLQWGSIPAMANTAPDPRSAR